MHFLKSCKFNYKYNGKINTLPHQFFKFDTIECFVRIIKLTKMVSFLLRGLLVIGFTVFSMEQVMAYERNEFKLGAYERKGFKLGAYERNAFKLGAYARNAFKLGAYERNAFKLGIQTDSKVGGFGLGQIGGGPLLTMLTKWQAPIQILDSDRNGIVYGHELHSAAMKLISHYQVAGDGVNGLMELERIYNDMTQEYFGVDGSEKGMTHTELVLGLALYWHAHFESFKLRVSTYYTAVFHAIDSNHDDSVSLEEFEYYFERYGSTDEMKNQAKKTFEIIDANGDGAIGEEEFRDAFVKYFTDPDTTYDELPLF